MKAELLKMRIPTTHVPAEHPNRLWARGVIAERREREQGQADGGVAPMPELPTAPSASDYAKVSDVVGSPRESVNYGHLALVMAARRREL
jgi:hypothetical protein